jgi:hypothetical protein
MVDDQVSKFLGLSSDHVFDDEAACRSAERRINGKTMF